MHQHTFRSSCTITAGQHGRHSSEAIGQCNHLPSRMALGKRTSSTRTSVPSCAARASVATPRSPATVNTSSGSPGLLTFREHANSCALRWGRHAAGSLLQLEPPSTMCMAYPTRSETGKHSCWGMFMKVRVVSGRTVNRPPTETGCRLRKCASVHTPQNVAALWRSAWNGSHTTTRARARTLPACTFPRSASRNAARPRCARCQRRVRGAHWPQPHAAVDATAHDTTADTAPPVVAGTRRS